MLEICAVCAKYFNVKSDNGLLTPTEYVCFACGEAISDAIPDDDDDDWEDMPSDQNESLLPDLPGSGLVRHGPEWDELWSDREEPTAGVAAFEERLRKARG